LETKNIPPLYFREIGKKSLYMGAVAFEALEHLSEFSTFGISYPQYLGSYPQG